jgi:membrane-associated protein
MHWPVFLFWNAVGGVAWATSVGLVAYFVGPAAEAALKRVGLVGAGLAVLLVVALVVRRHRRRRSNPEPAS